MKRDGWERLSVRVNTRPDRLPDRVGPSDLLYPAGHGKLAMFLLCGLAGFGLSLMLVLGPLVVVAAYTPLEIAGEWLWVSMSTGWVAFWVALFAAAIREDDELKRWVADQ